MSEKIHTTILVLGLSVLGISLLVSPDILLSSMPTFFQFTIIEYIQETPMEAVLAHEKKNLDEPRSAEEPSAPDAAHAEPIESPQPVSPEHLQPIRKEIIIPKEQLEKKRLPQATLYGIAAERVVNLFCRLENNEVAIATGVIIHENGYILTNAHITEAANPEPCLIRRGSPARNFAIASRVFMPPGFSSEKSTRENLARDIALWKISNVLNSEAATIFPSLVIRPTFQVLNDTPLSTFSYPAELLGSQTVVNALYLSFSETAVVSHDTHFIESTQGLGSQKGSSGGILLDPYTGEFAGLIFAINDEKTASISERILFSLTPFAINEAVRTATGNDLDAYLDSNPL